MANKKLTKKELQAILMDTYGYEKEDLKDADGKPYTNAKLESMMKQEEADAVELENEEQVYHAKASNFKDDDMIPVMNGLSGSLTHRSTTSGRLWKFKQFGQKDKMPYGELLSIRNLAPSVFEDGWLVVLNRQIQDDFGLTESYKNILTPENIGEVFSKDADEMKAFIESLPEGMKVTFVSKARELYNAKKLDSKRVIDFIENHFGVSLDDNAPLSDII
jgi:hypothetical protein